MGSHRYRVALAAYRGGCTYEPFKPFFKFEIRSRIRERLLLDVDSMYILAKQVEEQQKLVMLQQDQNKIKQEHQLRLIEEEKAEYEQWMALRKIA